MNGRWLEFGDADRLFWAGFSNLQRRSPASRLLGPEAFQCGDPLFISCRKPVLPSRETPGHFVRFLSAGSSDAVSVTSFDQAGRIIATERLELSR